MTLEVQTIRVSKTIPKKQADLMVKKMGFKLNVKPNPQYKNFHSYRQKFKSNWYIRLFKRFFRSWTVESGES